MTVVFNRPLVPRIDGSMTSLSTSRSLAAKGRLYRAEGRTKLAAQAAKSGAVVLDARTAEGRAVADALGAIDLDRWAELLARSFCDATIDRINATLVTEGEDWSLRLVRGTNVSFSVLDLAPLGTRIKQAGAVRVVLLSETDPTVARVRSMAATDPGAAALLITEYALRRLGLPRSRGVGLLAELGRRAVVGKARR
jgi:hypothetical protein